MWENQNSYKEGISQPLCTSIRGREEIAQTLFHYFLAFSKFLGLCQSHCWWWWWGQAWEGPIPRGWWKTNTIFHRSLSSTKDSPKEVFHFAYRGFLNHCILNEWKQFWSKNSLRKTKQNVFSLFFPCPWISCLYHINPLNWDSWLYQGTGKINFPCF